MNSFINNEKRGVELPRGCKDLMDLIQNPGLMQFSSSMKFDNEHSTGFEDGSRADLETQLCWLLITKRTIRSLYILCYQQKSIISFLNRDHKLRVSFRLNPAVRGDAIISGDLSTYTRLLSQNALSNSFDGDLIRVFEFLSLPSVPGLTELMKNLMTTNLGMTENEKLLFARWESAIE